MEKTFEEKCKEKHERLLKQAVRANTTYCILKQMLDRQENIKYLAVCSPCFYNTFVRNYIQVLFVETNKMFDNNKKSDGIVNLLKKMKDEKNQLKNNGKIEYCIFDKLTSKSAKSMTYNSIFELIDNSQKEISSNNDIIKRINKQRHKYYAHLDSETDVQKLFKEYPVSYSDIEKILLLNINILNSLNGYFKKATTYPVMINNNDVENTLYYVKKGITVTEEVKGLDYSDV